ncbi:MAG: hypothetical protein NT029_17965 [Armatimonadetes bacterium]|nr:hypothetical protein [Armatimonadota bacterium]
MNGRLGKAGAAAAVTLVMAVVMGRTSAQTMTSAPCGVAPRIDGVRSAGEWDKAAATPVALKMVDGKGRPGRVRNGELLVMNSRANLYVAFRIPDAARDASISPISADLAVLSFCRGEELAAGDDKRVVTHGQWADKHLLAPGKDADDTRKDGSAAMRWRSTGGGESFVEWRIPLKSGDDCDVSAEPGARLRFNLMYADKFSATLAETEFACVFAGDMDHAKGWGTIALADTTVTEAPAPAPDWIAALLPHTGAPDRLEHRLSRVDAGEIEVNGHSGGVATVDLTYPGIRGAVEKAQARIFLPPVLAENPGVRVPLVHVAGYEIDDAGAAGLLARGWAVSTIHAHPLNPLGRGVNLDRAVLHAAARLPFVDARRVSIQGGSAGGWMTLMLAADAFPLICSLPDVPVIHAGYNADYIARNQVYAVAAPGSDKPRMFFLQAVGSIIDQMKPLYGMPFDGKEALGYSPLAHLDTITAPILPVFTTADMLVPIDQVGAEYVQPVDAAQFPAGYSFAMTERIAAHKGARTLLAALPEGVRQVEVVKAAPGQARLGPDGAALGAGQPCKPSFSKSKTWSIVILDEGPKEPGVGHFKYAWSIDHEPFRAWAMGRGVQPEQLTAAKLERLMMRMLGETWRPFAVQAGGAQKPTPANQLDYPEAERADVLLGLAAYAEEDACASRLAALYAKLPVRLRALGRSLGDGSPGSVRATLRTVAEGRR